MTHEGYIKFQCELTCGPPPGRAQVEDLLVVRQKLFLVQLIGQDTDGVGFGNVSRRIVGSDQFYITGTQTGGLVTLRPEHISLVVTADLRQNRLRCSGAAKASSESLTHWAIYEADRRIHAVIHAHHQALWRHLIRECVPTTDRAVPYGTPEMGEEVKRLLAPDCGRKCKIIAMGGHEGGILSCGSSLEEAYSILMSWYGRVVQ